MYPSETLLTTRETTHCVTESKTTEQKEKSLAAENSTDSVRAERLWFDLRHEPETFLFPGVSGSHLMPTQLAVEWVPRFISSVVLAVGTLS